MVHIIHRIGLYAHRTMMRPVFAKPRLIVVLSTMRSGTSLLTRILSDNPQIHGYGESHVHYDSASAILDLKYWIFRFTRQYPRRENFLLDKILHKSHLPQIESLFQYAEVYPIFLVRDPASNVRSLQKLFRKGKSDSSELPWDYLEMRYAELFDYAEALDGLCPIASYSYEKLTRTPNVVLEDMGDFLSLKNALSTEYSTPSYLGRWGVGDGSTNIRSGRILMNSDQFKAPLGIEIPLSVTTAWKKLALKLAEVSKHQQM